MVRAGLRAAGAVGAMLSLLVLAACSGDEESEARGEDAGRVTVITPYTPPARLTRSLDAFEESSGIDVVVEDVGGDFAGLIAVRAREADPPDIAVFPQPALLEEVVEEGLVLPLPDDVAAKARATQRQDLIELAEYGGETYGLWVRVIPSSLVWFNRPAFERAGYEVPRTWGALEALTARMIADGRVPWCLGLEAQGATGWVLTNWLEDSILRFRGREFYNRWAAHEVPVDHPHVVAEMRRITNLLFQPGAVRGGATGSLRTATNEAPLGLTASPVPRCWLHRQASWVAEVFPRKAVVGPDRTLDIFAVPGPDAATPPPLEFGGDIAVRLTENPAAERLLDYLLSDEFERQEARERGFASARAMPDPGALPDNANRDIAEVVSTMGPGGFDASDLMPPEVGTGTLWAAMVDVAEGADPADALAAVERSWPEAGD